MNQIICASISRYFSLNFFSRPCPKDSLSVYKRIELRIDYTSKSTFQTILKRISLSASEKESAIVIDNGSGFCKAGIAGDAAPSVECPAVVGRPRYIPVVAGLNYRSAYVGWEAQARRGALSLSYPVRGGVIRHWDDLQLLWEHTFSHLLEVNPAKHPVIVTEAPKNPLRHREKIVELLFEDFNCPGVFVAVQAVMALYAGGRTTGMVLESGEGVTHVVPVYEGYAVHHSILRAEYSGRTVTDYLSELLTERGYYFTTTAEREILQDIKERLCFVSQDFLGDMQASAKPSNSLDHRYVLPDGQVLNLGSERFRCPEILMRPDFVNLEEPGFHAAIYDSLMKCDVDLRKDLMSNVLLSGGNTMFPGLPERLESELETLCPCPVKLTAPKERRYAVWLGASILGALSTFGEICVTRNEYEEHGPRIVHRKCF